MKSRSKTKRIAIALPSGITFVERILHGVMDYAAQRGGWSLIRIPERLDLSLDWLRSCDSDGAIVMISDEQAAKTARSLPMPVVNLSAYMDVPDLPTVMVDQKAVGRLAARHLLERSFTHCAYYGVSDMWYSRVRKESFVETVQAGGAECRVLEVPSAAQYEGKRKKQETLEGWLKGLTMPVGIMASTDLRACMAADACAMLGLRIPEDVVIVGVDNDPVSEFHDPPLSSVSRNDAQVGERAAQLLEHLMAGGSPPAEPILIAPDAVVCRRSTEALAIEDARIAKAVAYIHNNVHRPFGVEELLSVTAMPRRTFELHFLKRVGITPYSFINRCRVERASTLLTGPRRCSLTEIASLSGFSDLRRFRLVFRRLMGKAPASYLRNRNEVGPAEFDTLEPYGRSRRAERLKAA